jgi:AraC-like DNA-binding protein
VGLHLLPLGRIEHDWDAGRIDPDAFFGGGRMMDVLGDILSTMKLSGSVFLECEFSAPWCVTSSIDTESCAAFFPEPEHVIGYHYVISGSLLCSVGEGEPIVVRAGQIMLLPHGKMHLLGSQLDLNPTPSETLLQPSEDGGLMRIRWGGGGERTNIYCGFLGTLTPVNAFLMSLPKLLVIDASKGASGEWLASSFRFASNESAAGSPELLGRLAELLFLEAVKHYVANLPPGHSGWLSGLRDPHISRALTLIHSRYAEDWTTDALAREAGLSRSAFADRFTSLIGDPPMRYLSRRRMNAAANLLREGKHNNANIAYAIGFNSEAAFNRAFKKEFGTPPASWRREKKLHQPALA